MTWPVTQRGMLLVIIDKLRVTALRAINSELPYAERRHMHDYLMETRKRILAEVDAVSRTEATEEPDAMFYANLCALHDDISTDNANGMWDAWKRPEDRVEWLMGAGHADPVQ